MHSKHGQRSQVSVLGLFAYTTILQQELPVPCIKYYAIRFYIMNTILTLCFVALGTSWRIQQSGRS